MSLFFTYNCRSMTYLYLFDVQSTEAEVSITLNYILQFWLDGNNVQMRLFPHWWTTQALTVKSSTIWSSQFLKISGHMFTVNDSLTRKKLCIKLLYPSTISDKLVKNARQYYVVSWTVYIYKTWLTDVMF